MVMSDLEPMSDGGHSKETIEVPRALLELCLGIVRHANVYLPIPCKIDEDITLALAQLRIHLECRTPPNETP